MMKNRSKIKDQRSPPRAEKIQPCYRTSSRGVALILVLGVLTVMTLMAVAFSISMRTERVASGNYADTVRARQLVYAGLARAMEQINDEMKSDLSEPDALVYPDWVVTNSYTNIASFTEEIRLLVGEATNFVPRALWSDARSADQDIMLIHGHRWIPIHDVWEEECEDTGDTTTHTNLFGRVAYMILNCSGLIDANFAGGWDGGALIPRAQGTNPNEIALDLVPEIADAQEFLEYRADDIRYETLQELSELALWHPTNFFVYSRFPAGYWTNDAGGGGVSMEQANIINRSADDLEEDNLEADITNAFVKAGFTADEAGLLYMNLLCYVDDTRHLDGSIDNAYVRHMPMINEIAVSNSVSTDTDPDTGAPRYTISCDVFIELWNPFVNELEHDFELVYSVNFAPVNVPLDADDNSPVVPGNVSPTRVDVTVDPMDFLVHHVQQQVGPVPAVFPAGQAVELEVSVDAEIWRKDLNEMVDGIEDSAVFNVENEWMAAGDYEDFVESLECLDPRFNWAPDPADGQWRFLTNAHTLGSMNTWTDQYLDPAGVTNDGSTEMYLANRELKSVGELGYLAYAPWQTIRLHGPDLHPVLDYFAQGTNEVFRGLVNPNTWETDALAAVFAGMPVDRYPEESGAADLSWSDARTTAVRIFEAVDTVGLYTNISDVYRAMTNFPASADTKMKKDAFVRNAAGLLSVRQNLFTIIIEAQASRGLIMPARPARQRAVAVVWRDPYTGESFVRSLKWLSD